GKPRAEELAPHWRGSTYELRESKRSSQVVLLYAVEWDSEEAARSYFDVYHQALAKKWKKMEIASEMPDLLTGTGDDGRFELHRSGTIVTSMEGLPPVVTTSYRASSEQRPTVRAPRRFLALCARFRLHGLQQVQARLSRLGRH